MSLNVSSPTEHAIFSPSSPAWLRYSDEKAIEFYRNKMAAERGTRLHAWAQETIDLKIQQSRSNKTIYKYVNDAIGFGMDTEVRLEYSELFFGTADSLIYRNGTLRIHDLKTGAGPVHREQLEIYSALYCLQHHVSPMTINIVLRIYQNDDIDEWNPDGDYIMHIMDHIKHLDNLIRIK